MFRLSSKLIFNVVFEKNIKMIVLYVIIILWAKKTANIVCSNLI